MTLTTIAERLANEMLIELSTQVPPGCIQRSIGTIALLEEIPVAAAASNRHVLSEGTVRGLTTEASEQVRDDPGIGHKHNRTAYSKQLQSSRTAHAQTATVTLLRSKLPELDSEYLENWRLHLQEFEHQKTKDFVGYRYAAGRILAHLVYAGISPEIIRGSLNFLQNDNDEYEAAEIVLNFAERLARGPKRVEVLFFLGQTVSSSVQDANWMTASQVREWAEQRDLTQVLPKHFHGAILVRGLAWDKWHLREMATTVRLSIMARVRAISGQEIQISSTAVVDAFERTIKLDGHGDTHPRVTRYHLSELTLDTTDSSQPKEVAMDFYTAAVSANAPATRATLLWATIEALFTEPGVENVMCASHAANFAALRQTRRLVGISMKMLADNRGDPYYSTTVTNLSREAEYDAFVEYLRKNNFSRIRSAHCRALMAQVATRVTGSGMVTYLDSLHAQLRHLYRQRNLAVHGGITDSPLMATSSLLAEPTVAAAIDQVSSTSAQTRDEILLETGTCALNIDRIRAQTREAKGQKSDTVLSYTDLFG